VPQLSYLLVFDVVRWTKKLATRQLFIARQICIVFSDVLVCEVQQAEQVRQTATRSTHKVDLISWNSKRASKQV